MKSVLITAVLTVLLWLAPVITSQCPVHCTCSPNHMVKGRIIPIRAECNIVPRKLPPSITTIKVSNTEVPTITKDILSGVIFQLHEVKLESLQIEIIDDDAFQNAKNLKVLWLSKNKLKAITVNTFANCSQTTKLYLNENELEVVDDAFAHLTSLKELYLQRNRLTHVPSHLPPNLMMLDLHENRIGPEITSMSNLTHLTQLNLCSNPTTRLSLNTLESLGSLRQLCLGGNGVGLPQSAADHLPMLEDLSLTTMTDAQLDEVTTQELVQLKNIKILQIYRYHIESFEFLGKLKTIRKIQLDNITSSSEASTEFVGSLTGLNLLAKLQLDGSPQLAKLFVENAYKFKTWHLNTLSLRHNGLTSLHPTDIPSHNLPYLDISENPFHCDCGLEWLQNVDDLQNKQNMLCATPDEQYGMMVTNVVRDLNCTADDSTPSGDDDETHSSGHHGGNDVDNTTTHIIIGCVLAVLITAIIVLAAFYVLYKKRRGCNRITPHTEVHTQQQEVQTIQQARSNDYLLNQ